MKLVLDCTSSDGDANDIRFAVVPMNVDDAKAILRRRDVFLRVHAEDPSATGIEFQATVSFYEKNDVCDEALETARESVALLQESDAIEATLHEYANTDCDTIVVMRDQVWWSCLPPGEGATVTTVPVDYEFIEAVARGEHAATEPAPPSDAPVAPLDRP
jgi:hypothetical protein